MNDPLPILYSIDHTEETGAEDWLLQFNDDQKEAIRWMCSKLAQRELTVLEVPNFLRKRSELTSFTDLVMTVYHWYHTRDVQQTHLEETGEHPFEWEVDMNHELVEQLLVGFGSEVKTQFVNQFMQYNEAMREAGEPATEAVEFSDSHESVRPTFRRVDHLFNGRRR